LTIHTRTTGFAKPPALTKLRPNLDPALERSLVEVAKNQETNDGPGVVRTILDRVVGEVKRLVERGQEAVVLVRAEARTFLRDLLKSVAPRTVVLSYAEAAAAKRVEPVAVVTLAEPTVARAGA
jgi:flagellar biosynthesis component FlhA